MVIAPWGLTIKPGATYKYEIPPFANLKISNAALGAELEDERGRTTLTIETEERLTADSENEDEDNPEPTTIVLTSLTPGKVGEPVVYFTHGLTPFVID
jgi:FK506-binding nuclear protein